MTIPAIPTQPISPRTNRDHIAAILDSVWARPLNETVPAIIGAYYEDYIVLDLTAEPSVQPVFVQDPTKFGLFDATNQTQQIAGFITPGAAVIVEAVYTGTPVTGLTTAGAGLGPYTATVAVGNRNIMPKSVTVLAGAQPVAYDDGIGGWETYANTVGGGGGITVTGGSINYTTGAFTITFSGDPGGGGGGPVTFDIIGQAIQIDSQGYQFYPDTLPNLKYYLMLSDIIDPTAYPDVTITYGVKSLFRDLPSDLFLTLGAASPTNPSEIYEALANLKGAHADDWQASATPPGSDPLQGAGNDLLPGVGGAPPPWFHAAEVRNRIEYARQMLDAEHYNYDVSAVRPANWSNADKGKHKAITHYIPLSANPDIRTAVVLDTLGGTHTPLHEAIKSSNDLGRVTYGANLLGMPLTTPAGAVSGYSATELRVTGATANRGGAGIEMTYGRSAAAPNNGSAFRVWLHTEVAVAGLIPIIQAYVDAATDPAKPNRVLVGDGFGLVGGGGVMFEYKPFPATVGQTADPSNGVTGSYPDEVATVGWVINNFKAIGGPAIGDFIPFAGIKADPAVSPLIGSGTFSPTLPTAGSEGFFGYQVRPQSFNGTWGSAGILVIPHAPFPASSAMMRISANGLGANQTSVLLALDAKGPGGAPSTAFTPIKIDVTGVNNAATTRAIQIVGLSSQNRAFEADGGELFIGGSDYVHLNVNAGSLAILSSAAWSKSAPIHHVYAVSYDTASGAMVKVQANAMTVSGGKLMHLFGVLNSIPAGAVGYGLDIELSKTDDEVPYGIRTNAPIDMKGAVGGNNKIVNLATPTSNYDAATKKYVDDSINTVASVNVLVGSSKLSRTPPTGTTGGNVTLDVVPGNILHSTLGSLGGDDHTQYTLATGARAFTGIPKVSNATTVVPVADADLTTKRYVDLAVAAVPTFAVLGSFMVSVVVTTEKRVAPKTVPNVINTVIGSNSYRMYQDGAGADIAVAMWPTNMLFDRTSQNFVDTALRNVGTINGNINTYFGRLGSNMWDYPDTFPTTDFGARQWRHSHFKAQFYVPGQPIDKRSRGGTAQVSSGNSATKLNEIDGVQSTGANTNPVDNKNPDSTYYKNSAGNNDPSKTGAVGFTAYSGATNVNKVFPSVTGNDAYGNPYSGVSSSFLSMRVEYANTGLISGASANRADTGMADPGMLFHMHVEKTDSLTFLLRDDASSYIAIRPALRFIFIQANYKPLAPSVGFTVTLIFYHLGVKHSSSGLSNTADQLQINDMIP